MGAVDPTPDTAPDLAAQVADQVVALTDRSDVWVNKADYYKRLTERQDRLEARIEAVAADLARDRRAAPAAPVDPEPDRYTYEVSHDGDGWIILDGGNDAEMWAQDITDAQRLCRLLNAAPVDPWGPPRPMSELHDGHEEMVLVGQRSGVVSMEWRTWREDDEADGRVCWWPLPSVPAELREAQP